METNIQDDYITTMSLLMKKLNDKDSIEKYKK